MTSHSQNKCPLFAFPEHLFIKPSISVGNLLAGFLCTPPGWAACTLSKDFEPFGAAVSVPGTEQECTGLRLPLKRMGKDVGLKEGQQQLEGSYPWHLGPASTSQVCLQALMVEPAGPLRAPCQPPVVWMSPEAHT